MGENNIGNELYHHGIDTSEPRLIPIDIMMIAGDNNTPANDRVSRAQLAYVDPEWFHNVFLPGYYKLMDDINKHVEEVVNGK